MKTYEINAFEILESSKDDPQVDRHLMYVATLKLAEKFVSSSYHRRKNCRIVPYNKAIVVCETTDETEENSKEALMKSAMEKLSAAEKHALGLWQ